MIATGTNELRPRDETAARFCREILPQVSRTFALSIRVLPGTLGHAVLVAYLLCRIADTIEDEPVLPAERKAELLDALLACLHDPQSAARFPAALGAISGEEAHVRLAEHSDLVLAELHALPVGSRTHVRRWVSEMITGMRTFVLRYPHGIRIQSIDEYREYCYYVAGTVGYLLTDLWHEHAPRAIGSARYRQLRRRCRAFAEALQTVNILKDVAVDASEENSIYIPEQLLREHGSSHAEMLLASRARQTREALVALARLAAQDLGQAQTYLLTLPRRALSIRLFCALPLLFAYATLRDLRQAWRRDASTGAGPVVKISRKEVKTLTMLSILGIGSNRMLAWLARRAESRPVGLRSRSAAS